MSRRSDWASRAHRKLEGWVEKLRCLLVMKGVWRGLEPVATLSSPRPGHKSGAAIHMKHEWCEGLAKPPGARPKAAWLFKDPPTGRPRC